MLTVCMYVFDWKEKLKKNDKQLYQASNGRMVSVLSFDLNKHKPFFHFEHQ